MASESGSKTEAESVAKEDEAPPRSAGAMPLSDEITADELENVAGGAGAVVGGFKSVEGLQSETEVVASEPASAAKAGRTKWGDIVLKRG